MKRSRRKLLVCGAGAVLGSGSRPIGATARAPLKLWTMQLAPFHNAYVHGLIAGFEAAHPGSRVQWTDLPWAETERKVLTAIAAGEPPDVVNLNPQFCAKLAEHDALADPEQHLSPADIATFLPSAWSGNRLGRRTFALPWYLTSNITLAHRGMLEAAGGTVPGDADALLATARRLRSAPATATAGVYAYFTALDGSAPLETLAASLPPGRSLFTADGCAAGFVDASGRAFFDRHRTLYRERLVPPGVLTEGHRAGVTMFLSGQVAMVSTGLPFLEQVRLANPALYRQVVVAPQIGARKNISMMNLAVPARSRQPERAMQLARFVASTENQLALARRVPVLPSTRAAYDDALFTTAGPDPLLDRARALSATQVREGEVLVPPVRRWSQLRTSFVRNLQAVMLGRIESDAALADIDRTWRVLLDCSGRG